MFRSIRNYSCFIMLATVLAAYTVFPATTATYAFSLEDRVTIDRDIVFRRGTISASVRGRIMRGTTHLYRARAQAGQQMAVVLKTGDYTSATVFSPTGGIIEGADGIRQTLFELPETGEYVIQIATDTAANYTLEVTIK